MADLTLPWSWVSLGLLGAFHGLNPGMGWLFAVALGLQERRLRSVVGALGPIALGHALATGLVAVPVGLLGLVLPERALLALGGLALIAFAAYKLATRFRHPRWVGMRVGPRDLVLWSFLMATAHGAGLMLVPVLARLREAGVPAAAAADHADHARHVAPVGGSAGDGTLLAPELAAIGLHTAAMFLVMGVIAVAVYRKVGVAVLRRAWVNLDLVWVGALLIAGGLTLGLGLWPLLAG